MFVLYVKIWQKCLTNLFVILSLFILYTTDDRLWSIIYIITKMDYFDSNTYNNNGFDNGFDNADNSRLVKIIMFEIFHKINSLLYNPFFFI